MSGLMSCRRSGQLLVIALAMLGLVGCGNDVDRDEVVATDELARRLGLDPAEGACLQLELNAALDQNSIEQLLDEGILALPVDRWGAYVHATLECALYDELVAAPAGAGG